TVTTTTNHEIKEISNAKFDNDEAKAALLEIINDNKIVNYVQSANEGEDFLELTVITLGFHGNITNKITYDDSFVITAFVVTYDESYTNYDEWINNANGVHPKDKIPADIIANQDNLDNVAVVTGASVTSNA